jgi:hypothetical protein
MKSSVTRVKRDSVVRCEAKDRTELKGLETCWICLEHLINVMSSVLPRDDEVGDRRRHDFKQQVVLSKEAALAQSELVSEHAVVCRFVQKRKNL